MVTNTIIGTYLLYMLMRPLLGVDDVCNATALAPSSVPTMPPDIWAIQYRTPFSMEMCPCIVQDSSQHHQTLSTCATASPSTLLRSSAESATESKIGK